jgi:hypothetical protein
MATYTPFIPSEYSVGKAVKKSFGARLLTTSPIMRTALPPYLLALHQLKFSTLMF